MTREVDLIEEVARPLLDRIPLTMPLRRHVRGRLTKEQRLRRVVEDVLVGAGLSEAYTWSLVASDPSPDAIRLPNPMTSDQAILRTTIVPGLVEAARTGVDAGAEHVALFEIARVYLPPASSSLTSAGASPGSSRAATEVVKGVLETLLRRAPPRAARRARLARVASPGQGGGDRGGLARRAPPDAARGRLGSVRARSRDALRAGAGARRLRGRDHVSGHCSRTSRSPSTRTSRWVRSWTLHAKRQASFCARRACSTSTAATRWAGAQVRRDPPLVPVARADAHRRGGDGGCASGIVAALAERFGAELRA